MPITVLTTEAILEWKKALPIDRSVFGSIEYARIHEKFSNSLSARLLVWASGTQKVCYPFFLRPVDLLPFAPAETGWDITTPEYTGPIGSNLSPDISFKSDFRDFCQEFGIITEFAHLNPWESQNNVLETSAVHEDREIVYVDLTLSEQDLWDNSFTYACRKNIRRAQREQVQVFPATDLEHIRDFYQIYIQTMERNQARKKYFFPFEFFKAFFETMSSNALFMMAVFEGRVVAGTLYLHDDDNAFSYLGGADHEFQNIRPTNLVIFEAIKWAKKKGKKRLVLGGGYQVDDGIFRFKSSFSPNRTCFEVYKTIHSYVRYESLCKAWSHYYQIEPISTQYFPVYRTNV